MDTNWGEIQRVLPRRSEDLQFLRTGQATIGEDGHHPQTQFGPARVLGEGAVHSPLGAVPPFAPVIRFPLLGERGRVSGGPVLQGPQADGGADHRRDQHGQRAQGGEDLPPLGGAGLDDDVDGSWRGCHGTSLASGVPKESVSGPEPQRLYNGYVREELNGRLNTLSHDGCAWP